MRLSDKTMIRLNQIIHNKKITHGEDLKHASSNFALMRSRQHVQFY